mgnify:CR=1 FL=1
MAQQQDTVVPPTSPNPQPQPIKPQGLGGLQAAQYIIYGTNQPYSGRVVEVGGQLYTTQGGALEGYSFQLIPRGGQNDTIPQPDTFTPESFRPNVGQVFPQDNGDNITPDSKIPPPPPEDDPMVFDPIIIDDPMAPDPLANQGGSGY